MGIGDPIEKHDASQAPPTQEPAVAATPLPNGYFIWAHCVETLENMATKFLAEERQDLVAAGQALEAIAKLTRERPTSEVPMYGASTEELNRAAVETERLFRSDRPQMLTFMRATGRTWEEAEAAFENARKDAGDHLVKAVVEAMEEIEAAAACTCPDGWFPKDRERKLRALPHTHGANHHNKICKKFNGQT